MSPNLIEFILHVTTRKNIHVTTRKNIHVTTRKNIYTEIKD